MVSAELLEILRCPFCVQEREGMLKLEHETWLVCQEDGSVCGRKYPIRDDIPVMLIDEGEKWIATVVADLSVPPPEE